MSSAPPVAFGRYLAEVLAAPPFLRVGLPLREMLPTFKGCMGVEADTYFNDVYCYGFLLVLDIFNIRRNDLNDFKTPTCFAVAN